MGISAVNKVAGAPWHHDPSRGDSFDDAQERSVVVRIHSVRLEILPSPGLLAEMYHTKRRLGSKKASDIDQ